MGAPRGTSRSSGELVVHTNTPRDSCSPIDDQLWQVRERTRESLTNKRPTWDMLRLETTYLDEITSQPEILERSYVGICIDMLTQGILAGQGAIRKEVQHDDGEGAFA